MRGLLTKVAVAGALVAVIAVPAASATSSAVKLSVLPLPNTLLGPAKSLPLEHDSGVVTNADAAAYSLGGATASLFANFGRFGGYALDYGVGANGGAGVTEVTTEVDKFVQARGAKEDLDFWKRDDAKITEFNQGGFHVTNKPVSVPKVGGIRFAFLASYTASNISPLFTVDEQFTQGVYEADVRVSAGTAAGAEKLAPKLAKAVDARIEQALAGKLEAKPVKLLPKQKAGAVQGSPDLSTLALKTSDVSGTATINGQGYLVDASALSHYSVVMLPAGQFGLLDQELQWFSTANQAAFEADFAEAQALGGGGASQLDLSSVGDGAQGVIATDSTGGAGEIVLSSGKLAEVIVVVSQQSVQASDVQNLAQTAANYVNSAGLGS